MNIGHDMVLHNQFNQLELFFYTFLWDKDSSQTDNEFIFFWLPVVIIVSMINYFDIIHVIYIYAKFSNLNTLNILRPAT